MWNVQKLKKVVWWTYIRTRCPGRVKRVTNFRRREFRSNPDDFPVLNPGHYTLNCHPMEVDHMGRFYKYATFYWHPVFPPANHISVDILIALRTFACRSVL